MHVCIDDHSRLAYVETLANERAETTTAFLRRAVRWFQRQGIRAERVMTDNGSGYVSKAFRQACMELGVRHLRTRPYTPKTNGKAKYGIDVFLPNMVYGALVITPRDEPPGALREDLFLSRCIQCGQCMRVCPTGIIQSAGTGTGGMWTPGLNFRIGSSGCQLACTACGHACPTAAIGSAAR